MRDGRVFIDGGVDCSGNQNPDEIYDPSTGKFTDTGVPLLGYCRGLGTSALLPDGRILLAFGMRSGVTDPTSDAETYDPSTGKFSAVSEHLTCQPLNYYSGLYGVRSTTLNNGSVLLTGGSNKFDGEGASATCAELFDPSTNTLSTTNPMTTDRYLQSSTMMPDGRVLIAGGLTFIMNPAYSENYHASAEIYDPRTGLFNATGPMTDSRYSHTGTLLPNGQALIVGGANSSGPVALPWVDLYTESQGTFARILSLPSGRYEHTATFFNSGLALVTGGRDSSGKALASAELYRPANSVNLAEPQSGDIVFGGVHIEVSWDYNSYEEARVYVDGNLVPLGTVFQPAPQNVFWNSSGATNGLHVIRADALNNRQQVVGSSSISVNLANGPVALFWPKENATVSHTVAIAATKGSGVQWIDFYVDGTFVKSTPPNTLYWDSSTVANGSHILSAKGFNSSGQLAGTDSVVVNVLN